MKVMGNLVTRSLSHQSSSLAGGKERLQRDQDSVTEIKLRRATTKTVFTFCLKRKKAQKVSIER